jgi:hypothetical protein
LLLKVALRANLRRELNGREAVIDKLVYTATNPVMEHLVDSVHHWPGAADHAHRVRPEDRSVQAALGIRHQSMPVIADTIVLKD